MSEFALQPRIFHLLQQDALHIARSAYGNVGMVYSDAQIEAVWVSKQNEAIEPGWFSQPMVDLLVVIQGQLHVEFEKQEMPPQILNIGDMLVLPSDTRCRAYRWPRDREGAAVFLAVYPRQEGEANGRERV
jgi:hypothetical protein